MAVPKGDLHQRNHALVALLDALELQQVVIGTARVRGKVTTDPRARIINRALPRLRIQELTGFAEDRVSLLAQDALSLVGLGESRQRGLSLNLKMPGNAFDITSINLDPLVNRATIRGAFRAVVVVYLRRPRHHP